jgi:hypothetical protein
MGKVGVGEVVVESTFSGKSVPRGAASAISLRAGNVMGFVWAFRVFAGLEALVVVKSAEPART